MCIWNEVGCKFLGPMKFSHLSVNCICDCCGTDAKSGSYCR